MEQVVQNGPKLPKSDIGYLTSNEDRKNEYYATESHIYKQGPLSGVNAGLHKLSNDIFTYFPKGFQGSKNSDFYEYLSLGMVPYIIGSALLIALYSAANKHYNLADKASSAKVAKTMGAGVVLYGLGKWLFKKITHSAIKGSTGIDLDMRYINKVNELPEHGHQKGLVREQYPGVYDSATFFRSDLLAADGEINHGNVYHWDDKITQKAGFETKLYAPNQIANEKTRKVLARIKALENVGKYIFAATGVALGSQEAFENVGKVFTKYAKKYVTKRVTFFDPDNLEKMKTLDVRVPKFKKLSKLSLKTLTSPFEALGKAFVQLWKGDKKNLITKYYGKALILSCAISAFLTWLIPTIGFKRNPNTIKTKIDENKKYEVC